MNESLGTLQTYKLWTKVYPNLIFDTRSLSILLFLKSFRPHPHSVIGKGGYNKSGVYTEEVGPANMVVVFKHLGIQCVKRKDAEAALRLRELIRVDPFKSKPFLLFCRTMTDPSL